MAIAVASCARVTPVSGQELIGEAIASWATDFSATGADLCTDAVVIPVVVGPPGFPETVTVSGDAVSATGPDCQPSIGAAWWEAFHIDRCATVTLSYCGTDIFRPSGPTFVIERCSTDRSCSLPISATETSNEACGSPKSELKGDPNLWMKFDALPPGTYYYPVATRPVPPLITSSSYVLNISAESCRTGCAACLGACCDANDQTCKEDVFNDDCMAPGQTWFKQKTCCETECLAPGAEFSSSGMNLLSRVPLDAFPSGSSSANDVWGYVSPAGNEYAIIGLEVGTGFVDITDPLAPRVIADIPDDSSTTSDMAVFEQTAYNVNGSGSGLQIMDISKIDAGEVTLLGIAAGGLLSAHNIFVNQGSGYAYACSTNLTRGFVAYDLADPKNPQPVGLWDGALAHDLYVTSYDDCPYDDRAGPCEIAFVMAGGSGVVIVDVTDKTNMFTVATHTYPTLRFCHQGWLDENKRFLFFGDEADERSFDLPSTTYVIDVRDVGAPKTVASFSNGMCAIDHNLMTRGEYVFEANYSTGLRVFDAKNPSDVREIAFFDTHPNDNNQNFSGAWGVFAAFPSGAVAVSDRQRGLFLVALCGRAARDGKPADLGDFARVQNCFRLTPTPLECQNVDMTCDGTVDLTDLAALLAELAGPPHP